MTLLSVFGRGVVVFVEGHFLLVFVSIFIDSVDSIRFHR